MSFLIALNYLRGISVLVAFIFLSSRSPGNLAFVGLKLLVIRYYLLSCEFLKADPLTRSYLLSIFLFNVDASHSWGKGSNWCRLLNLAALILYCNWTFLFLTIFHHKRVIILVSSWNIYKLAISHRYPCWIPKILYIGILYH
jgi:hypothetical protein